MDNKGKDSSAINQEDNMPMYPLLPGGGNTSAEHHGRPTGEIQPAVVDTKGGGGGAVYPGLMDNVPLGLDALIDVDQIFIKQHIETLEFLFGSNAANKYSITDPSGRNILYAAEFSNIFARHLIGKSRGFNLKIFNSVNNKEVLNAKRRFKCGLFACCLPRCLEDMQVESFGSVVQVMPSCCKMHFAINDEHGETHFEVRPPQKMIFFSDWEFQIFDAAGNNVGEIRKKWAGIGQEMFTSADNFGIKFPANLDVKYKALLISCCILLDFIYFEQN